MRKPGGRRVEGSTTRAKRRTADNVPGDEPATESNGRNRRDVMDITRRQFVKATAVALASAAAAGTLSSLVGCASGSAQGGAQA